MTVVMKMDDNGIPTASFNGDQSNYAYLKSIVNGKPWGDQKKLGHP